MCVHVELTGLVRGYGVLVARPVFIILFRLFLIAVVQLLADSNSVSAPRVLTGEHKNLVPPGNCMLCELHWTYIIL